MAAFHTRLPAIDDLLNLSLGAALILRKEELGLTVSFFDPERSPKPEVREAQVQA